MKNITLVLIALSCLCAYNATHAASLDGAYTCVAIAAADKGDSLDEVERRGLNEFDKMRLWLNADGTYRISSAENPAGGNTGRYLAGPGGILFMFPDPMSGTTSRWDYTDSAVLCTIFFERHRKLTDPSKPVFVTATFRKQ